jgi:hypothetical protein
MSINERSHYKNKKRFALGKGQGGAVSGGSDEDRLSEIKKFINQTAESLTILAPEVVLHLYPNGFEEGGHWCLGDVTGRAAKNKGSFRIALEGPKMGLCKEFADPESKAFDLLTAWATKKGISLFKAATEAKDVFGLTEKGDLKRKDKAELKDRIDSVRNKMGAGRKSGAWKTAVYNDEVVLKAMARLKATPAAMQYLLGKGQRERGLTEQIVTRFRLGLTSQFYDKERNITRQDALSVPIIDKTGQFTGRTAYYCIPNLTINPIDKNGWMAGDPAMYYARALSSSNTLFVCEGMKDSWAHAQGTDQIPALERAMEIVSSTHGAGWPPEYSDPAFWGRYKHILFGHDNDDAGEQMAKSIAQQVYNLTGQRCRRVRVPKAKGKDWTDFWKCSSAQEFLSILKVSGYIAVQLPEADSENTQDAQAT